MEGCRNRGRERETEIGDFDSSTCLNAVYSMQREEMEPY